VKAKVIPVHAEGVKVWLHSFLTMALDGDKWLASCPSHFILAEENLVPTEYEVVCARE